MKLRNFLIILLLGILLIFPATTKAAKNLGESCLRPADCASGFCGENGYGGAAYTCQGTLGEGQSCSLTDQRQACQSNLYCDEGTSKCVIDPRGTKASPITDSIVQQQAASQSQQTLPSGYAGPDCPTCFTNPLQFTKVEDFLTYFLVVLQRIIVTLSLVAIVFGAVMYIIEGTSGKVENAKKIITSALTGLAIGIAAPSILKEVTSVLGWGTTTGNPTVDTAMSFSDIAVRVLNFLLGTMGILALIIMVIGSIMYLTSAGDSGQADKGKGMFKNALIGLVLAMSAMVLVTQVAQFFAK